MSAAAGVLQPVVEKLTNLLLGEDHKRFEPMRGEIESLTHELDAMMAFLIERSKVEDPDDGQDRLWMKDVRELSYDIEDSLDEFLLHATDRSAEPDGFMEKVRSLVERTKSRHRVAREIGDLKKKAIEAAERNQSSYRAGDQPVVSATATNASIDPRALAMLEDATKLAGIDGPNGELIRLLEEDQTGHDSVHQQARVVSIVGSGGIGKTALAHQVYQAHNGGFLHRAFLSVSRNPDIKGILRSVLYQVVSPKDYEAVVKGDHVIREAGADQLITKIREYLTDRRYYLKNFRPSVMED